MVRAVCVWAVALNVFAGLAWGDSGALLSTDRQTVQVAPGPGGPPMIAFFELQHDHADVTMLIQDDDGVLRTRVRLLDGQKHAIVVENDTRYLVHRTGDVVHVTAERTTGAF